MSGTSLDGLDVVLAALPQKGPEVLHARTYEFSPDSVTNCTRSALRVRSISSTSLPST